MTTEREFREWPEKIRRVRGQRPVTSVHRRRKNSPWLPIVLFIAGLAIATAASNHLQQQKSESNNQLRPLQEFRL